jgi:uncharacterized membrane protein YphA (DoxX/SURF4 family)
MSGTAKINEGRTAAAYLFIRIMLAGFLLMHSTGQLMAFWQASRIINPGAFLEPVLLQNAALPLAFFIGAVMLIVGFKARFAAITLLVLLAGTSAIALVVFGSLGGVLNWAERLTVILGLVIPAMDGAGRLSIDGLMASRIAARAAQ